MLKQAKTIFTPEEYLAMEQVAEYKSEYYSGEIFAMSGGTADHSLIEGNLYTTLNQLLESIPCRVFTSDMRLFVQQSDLYTYPDAMIVCGKIQFVLTRKDTITNPIVIVEVLSPSTRDYDHDQKFNFYKQIPTVKEYVLVESEKAHVECYRRGSGKKWMSKTFDGLNAIVKIESVACEIPMRKIYNKVSWM